MLEFIKTPPLPCITRYLDSNSGMKEGVTLLGFLKPLLQRFLFMIMTPFVEFELFYTWQKRFYLHKARFAFDL